MARVVPASLYLGIRMRAVEMRRLAACGLTAVHPSRQAKRTKIERHPDTAREKARSVVSDSRKTIAEQASGDQRGNSAGASPLAPAPTVAGRASA